MHILFAKMKKNTFEENKNERNLGHYSIRRYGVNWIAGTIGSKRVFQVNLTKYKNGADKIKIYEKKVKTSAYLFCGTKIKLVQVELSQSINKFGFNFCTNTFNKSVWVGLREFFRLWICNS